MEPLIVRQALRESWASGLATRRSVLKAAAWGTASWLTPLAEILARDAEAAPRGKQAQSLIFVWLAGGPSQLETFDPHPGKKIAGETKAIDTPLAGIQLAEGYERLAEQLPNVTLVRNVVSKEGDHERGSYTIRTGYRPDPTLVHPTIGAICCHQLPVGNTEIPRHVSILPGRFPARGGYLGSQYDAFKTYDPKDKVPDLVSRVADERQQARLDDLKVIESAFARGRQRAADATLHTHLQAEARRMSSSEQVAAFDVMREPQSVRDLYGDTRFGRGCLAARRLVEVGVRCVEVTLDGWDSHTNNYETQLERGKTLDPALSALLADLHQRKLLDSTLVVCAGEFGRTPKINATGGRDHWPKGFSVLLAGGRLPRGHVVGETDPDGGEVKYEQGTPIADLHATLLTALGIDPTLEMMTRVGRPMRLCEGKPVSALLT